MTKFLLYSQKGHIFVVYGIFDDEEDALNYKQDMLNRYSGAKTCKIAYNPYGFVQGINFIGELPR